MNYLDSLKQQNPAIAKYSDDEIISILPDLNPTLAEYTPDQLITFATSEASAGMMDIIKSGYQNVTGSKEVTRATKELDQLNQPDFAGIENAKSDNSSFMGVSADELRRRSIAGQDGGDQQLEGEAQNRLDRGGLLLDEASKVRLSSTTQKFLSGSDEDSSVWSDFVADPVTIITEIGAQSAYGSAEALGTGLLMAPAGPIGIGIGSGVGSGRIEFANTVTEELRSKGFDITNASKLREQLASNPEVYAEAKEKGLKRAAAIGAMDAATFGLASKSLGIGTGFIKQATNLGAQTAVQAAGGATGEAIGQLWSEGQIKDGRAIAAEAVGELVTAPVDVYAATRDYMGEANQRITLAKEDAAAAGGDALDQALAGGQAQADATPEAVAAQKQQANESQHRDMTGIDGLIITAKRMGFEEETARLTNAQNLFKRADQYRQAGDHQNANRLAQKANAIYQDVTEVNEPLKQESANYPAPYTFQGEVQGGELAPSAAVNNQSSAIDGELSPKQLSYQTGLLSDQSSINRLEQSGIIYGEKPEYTAANREQQQADHFNALYGQNGNARVAPQEGELLQKGQILEQDRILPNHHQAQPALEDRSAKRIPQGDDVIYGQKPAREFNPVDPVYADVGRNIAERQAPTAAALPNKPVITQQQLIDYQAQYRQAEATPVSKRTDEQKEAVAQVQAVKAGDVEVVENSVSIPNESETQQALPLTGDTQEQPAADLSGEQIDGEWTAFAPETNTLGIPRSEMPQVKAEHRGAMANFMNARGIEHQKEEVKASDLKPTQAEFSPAKVKKAMEYVGGDRSILISADGHVLDGHHQWLAKREKGEDIKVIRLNADINDLVELAHEFPSSEVADGASQPNNSQAKAEQSVDQTEGNSFSSDITYQEAYDAYRGISHVPEDRAKQTIEEYSRILTGIYNNLNGMARNEDERNIVDTEFNRFRTGYRQKYKAYLSAKSKTMSSMITGPARFPVARNQKAMSTEDKRYSEFKEFTDKAIKSIKKQLRPEDAPIRSGEAGAIDKLQVKLDNAVSSQEKMKLANRIIRSKKDVKARLVDEVGLKESQAEEIMKPDFAGRVGFASYALTNNNAEIQRLKKRIEEEAVRAKQAEEATDADTEFDFEGGQVELDYDDNRIRIRHDSKPDEDVRSQLKKSGWRWSRNSGAWQRQLTNAAKHSASTITGVEFDAAFSRTASGASFLESAPGNLKTHAGLTVDAVQAASATVAKRLRLRGVSINVVATEADLPAAILKQAEEDGAQGQIGAVYHNKAIHVVADRMGSVSEVETAIFHEVAHYGGRALFGKGMTTAYNKLWMKIGGVKRMQAMAEEADLGDVMKPYFETANRAIQDGSLSASDRAAYLVDEFVAHLNQQQASEKLPARIVRAIKEFVGAVRDALRKLGYEKLSELSDSDLAYLLKKVNKAARGDAEATDRPHFMRITETDERNIWLSNLADELEVEEQAAMMRESRKESGVTLTEKSNVSRATPSGPEPTPYSQPGKSSSSEADSVASDDSIASDKPRFSRKAPVADGFGVPEESLVASVITKMADKFKVLKNLQKGIKENGGSITEESDAYMAEELFHGKAENDLRQMKETFVEPLAKKMAQAGITQTQLDEYLYAKHAAERNAHIAEINPEMQDGGSGMTDAEAGKVLAKVHKSGQEVEYDEAASIVYDMLAARREEIRNNGLEDDSLIDAWESKYQFYVPLKGFAENEQQDGIARTSKGFTIGGKESKRAMGRSSEAASPLNYTIQDLSETLVRKRKNEVGNAFLKMVEENSNQEYWQVFTDENPETDRRIVKRKNAETGEMEEVVKEQPIPMAMMTDRYFTTKRDGKTYYVKLEDPRLMKAMKNIGPDTSNFFIQGLSTVNRLLSSLNTSYNPEFIVSNFARDIQTAALNLSAEQSRDDGKINGEAIVKQTVKDVPKAMRAVYRSLRGKAAHNSEWAKWFDEFREQGTKTGYFDMKDIDGQAKEVEQLIDIANGGYKGSYYKWSKAGAKLVEDMNNSVENAVRLSAYVNARKAGISKAKAASLAKNMTVNFNRRGEWGVTMNALYMFANASVQGVMNFSRTMVGLKGEKGDPMWSRLNTAQKIAVGLMGSAYGIAMANRMAAGDDDDGENFYDKVPQYVKERNIVIMKSLLGGNQDGSYFKIPLPYGYNIFHVFGTSAESVSNGNTSAGQAATDLALATLGSFSPIGFQDSDSVPGLIMKNLTPTIGKPIVDVALNENFMGSSIYNKNFPFGTPKPDSGLSRRSTPEGYKAIAEFLNDVSGGSRWRSGAIDINPDVMRYFANYFMGGAGNFAFSKVPDNSYRLYNGVELPAHRTVFLGRVNGQVLPYQDQSLFYDRRDEVNQAQEELKALRGGEKARFYRDNRQKLALRGLIKSSEKQLKALRKQRDRIYGMKLSPSSRDKRLKMIEEKMKAVVDRFNRTYNKTEN